MTKIPYLYSSFTTKEDGTIEGVMGIVKTENHFEALSVALGHTLQKWSKDKNPSKAVIRARLMSYIPG